MKLGRTIKQSYSSIFLAGLVISLLSACGGVKDGPPENFGRKWDDIQDAVPKDEAHSKYGNPGSYEVFGERYYVRKSNDGFAQKGIASWYGSKFHGQRTSSGETYNMYAMTAAHKSLRIPAYVEVTNLDNGRKAVVKVNDRGPFHDGRIIDLSYAAAKKLGVSATGTARVSIRVVNSSNDSVASHHKSADSIDASYVHDGGRVYVQIAAFSTEQGAMKMIKDLREKNFSSVRVHVESNQGKTIYRVRIGPVPTTYVAQKLVTQLKEIKHDDVQIITYN
jgi:rare lipoprotein A